LRAGETRPEFVEGGMTAFMRGVTMQLQYQLNWYQAEANEMVEHQVEETQSAIDQAVENEINPPEENQLFSLLHVLHVALRALSPLVLVTRPQWTAWDRAWRAAQQGRVREFEQAINDLDSSIHVHQHQALGPQASKQYLVVRDLIHCVQGIWPYFFEAR
jgi:hypothetical protein